MPHRLLYPTFIFANNTRDQNSFTSSSIIDKLEGLIDIEVFRDALIRNIELKENRSNTPTIRSADLIKQQKEELENLERMERKRRTEQEEKIKTMEMEKMRIKQEVIYYLFRKKSEIGRKKRR